MKSISAKFTRSVPVACFACRSLLARHIAARCYDRGSADRGERLRLGGDRKCGFDRCIALQVRLRCLSRTRPCWQHVRSGRANHQGPGPQLDSSEYIVYSRSQPGQRTRTIRAGNHERSGRGRWGDERDDAALVNPLRAADRSLLQYIQADTTAVQIHL